MSITYETIGLRMREIRLGVSWRGLPLRLRITCPGTKNPRPAAKNNIQLPMEGWMTHRSAGNIEVVDGGNSDAHPRQTSCEEGDGGWRLRIYKNPSTLASAGSITDGLAIMIASPQSEWRGS